jgi:UDP-glucose:(glucosyl)LPS alpha-1,2-glucosyltransferase
MPLAKDELSTNAMGGSELMKYRMADELKALGDDILEPFQIFVSRVQEELDPNKIKIYWHQDLPEDPACDILRDKGWEKFDYFVFNSAWQMQMFNLYHGVPYSRSMVLMNAIDPIEVGEKPKDTIRLIYHSTPHRGLELLVPVFEKLCETHNDIELDVYSSFKIYGWEERDKQYEQLFAKCKSHPKINYHGSVPNAEVKAALAKAHIFAYPSIWIESSCIALMEAMSAGLVCCHSNLGALIDTSGGITRMYQFDEDPSAHATRFYGVLDQAIQDVRAGHSAAETQYVKFYADNRFSWDRRSMEWKAFIKMLLALKERGEMPRKQTGPVFVYNTNQRG